MTLELTKIPDMDYHALEALSSSGIKQMLKSPAHYQASLSMDLDTKALRIGTAVHQIILGGDNVRVFEGASFRSKSADIWKHQNAGFTHMLQSEWDEASIIAEHVASDPDWQRYDGVKEIAMIGEHQGVFCKAKGDIVNLAKSYCVDLKTTSNLLDFERDIFKYRYDIQAAWYNRMFGTDVFIFAAIENAKPYKMRFFELEQEVLDNANNDIDFAIETYKTCLKSGEWPGPKKGIEKVGLPAWMRTRLA